MSTPLEEYFVHQSAINRLVVELAEALSKEISQEVYVDNAIRDGRADRVLRGRGVLGATRSRIRDLKREIKEHEKAQDEIESTIVVD